MPSSRCLFRLAPSEPPTDETGCSSSQGVLLQTPTTVQTDEPPEKMRARAEKNGYKNGTKFGSLTSQIKYDERVAEMLYPTPQTQGLKVCDENGKTQFIDLSLLPTPRANVVNGCDLNNPKLAERHKSNLEEEVAKAVVNGLLPTPTAIEGVKWTNTWNPNSQMGQSLSAMAGSGMLPTPIATDISHKQRVENLKAAGGQTMASRANGANRPNGLSDFIHFYEVTKQETDAGKTSRLSPLFTEEMMGFPLMWTALPFLSESGAPKPSKPTATR